MILICDQRTIDEMSPEEQKELLETILDDREEGFSFKAKRNRKRQTPTGSSYHTPPYWARKIGRSENWVRNRMRGKPGVETRTFSGRNRKTTRVMMISETAIKREFPDVQL